METKKEKSVTKEKTRSPKKYKDTPTQELLNLIEGFNLTTQHNLPNYQALRNQEIENLGNEGDAEAEYQAELKTIRKLILHLENIPGLLEHLGFKGRKPQEIIEDENELDAFRFNYEVFLLRRSTLRAIISRLKRLRKNNNLPAKRPLVLTTVSGALAIVIHPDNSLRLSASPFEFFEIDDHQRLKECEMCENVFWAFRLDAHTCSEKCANRRRQRNYRSKTKES